ncbi:MAG TPA: SpoIID/LytB domain-containing protein [Rhabdochlamydiaceae bacterium]|jgi:stage II sporulation protein D
MKILSCLTSLNLAIGALAFLNSAHSSHAEIPFDVSQKTKPATMRVLLSENSKEALLEVKGHHQIYNPQTRVLLSNGITSKRDFVHALKGAIAWGEEFPGVSNIRIVPIDAQTSILVNGIEYRGCMEIYASRDGALCIVNEIDLERYLKSVLSRPWSDELDSEVLEAVAILARTHAYYLMSHNPSALWQISALEAGYTGEGLNLQHINIEHAISNTRHMILTYKDAPFPATWTKNSAGKTADFATIFRKDIPSPRGVSSPIAAKERPKCGWFFEISKRELARIIDAQKISDIALYEDKHSQKVYALRVKTGEEIHTIDFLMLQEKLGPSSLKSNDFTITTRGDKVVFKGFGEGHGVGLCLLSASLLAEKGEKADQILARFFPNTELKHYIK